MIGALSFCSLGYFVQLTSSKDQMSRSRRLDWVNIQQGLSFVSTIMYVQCPRRSTTYTGEGEVTRVVLQRVLTLHRYSVLAGFRSVRNSSGWFQGAPRCSKVLETIYSTYAIQFVVIYLVCLAQLRAQVEPGDRGSANLNGSFNVAPRSSKVLQGCPRLVIVCIAPRFLEQFIFLQGLGALESS